MFDTTIKWYKDYAGDGSIYAKKVYTIDFGEVDREKSCDGCKSYEEYGMTACEGCAG